MVSTHLRESDEVVEEGRRASSRTASNRHVCMSCRARRSLFRYGGGIRADRDHTLCFQCYRALRDTMRARLAQTA
jgi:hypothetical protein